MASRLFTPPWGVIGDTTPHNRIFRRILTLAAAELWPSEREWFLISDGLLQPALRSPFAFH